MIKISRLADYAVVVLGTLAGAGDQRLAAAGVSARSGLPEPTAAKVLKLLARADLVNSTRGVNGGYKMTRTPAEISVAEMVAAVDGPVALTLCATIKDEGCDYACSCPIKGGWNKVNDAVIKALQDVTLAELLGQNIFYKEDEVA